MRDRQRERERWDNREKRWGGGRDEGEIETSEKSVRVGVSLRAVI